MWPFKKKIDFPNLSPRALQKVIAAQAYRIERQTMELDRMTRVHTQDAENTSFWNAVKFALKCLTTKKTYGRR